MKQKLTYLCALAALLTATACTHDDAPGGTAEGTASASFHITTRADGTTNIGQGQHAWLYLAERLPELPNGKQLYCDHRYPVGSGAYLIEGLTAQWYKLAFICLPQGVNAPTVDNNHEFNDYVIDYSPVLITQDALNPDKDLAIYRQIIDRWLLPDEKLTENVTLTRITGQFILDMGILKDQFPGRVSQITVSLSKVPQKVYLRDNGNGEILYPTEDGNTSESLSPYSFDITDEDWQSNDHFRVYLDLLPFELKNATVTVKHLAPVVGQTEMQEIALPFPLVSGHHSGGETGTISVKPNTRTTVYFRGMESDEFEVRYAGFDNQSIDVDGGEWNGWN